MSILISLSQSLSQDLSLRVSLSGSLSLRFFITSGSYKPKITEKSQIVSLQTTIMLAVALKSNDCRTFESTLPLSYPYQEQSQLIEEKSKITALKPSY